MEEHDDLSERARRYAKEQEEKASALNEVLKRPAKLECFVEVTIRACVEVDSDGCGDDEGKEELFRSAIDQFTDATGVQAYWDDHDLSCAVRVEGKHRLWLKRDWRIREHDDGHHPISITY